MATTIQDCDCGFIDYADPTRSVFTSLLFLNFASITSEQLEDVLIQATYPISQSHTPYIRNFSTDQVKLSKAGLELTVSPPDRSKNVPCAQVFTRSSNFFYGSYRARISVGDVAGTVTALYNYKNDSSEVDMEYLSSRHQVLYSVKPQLYLGNGNPDSRTYQQEPWNEACASFDKEFHDWSFVWLPEVIHYGLDANYSKSITTNVPQAPGRLALNHWSNGDPNYSMGPPTRNSTITVSFFQAAYNDTSAAQLACRKASIACLISDGTLQSSSTATSLPGSKASASPTFALITATSSACCIGPTVSCWLFILVVLLL